MKFRLVEREEICIIPKDVAVVLHDENINLDDYEVYDETIKEYVSMYEWFNGFYILLVIKDNDKISVIAGLDVPDSNDVLLNLYVFSPE